MLRITIYLATTAAARFDENRLVNRLLGGYRMEFYQSENCPISEEEGKILFQYSPLDTKLIPDDCVRYIEDEDAEYNPIVRPVANYTDSLSVEMSLTLLQVIELNERQQFLQTSVMHDFRWIDENLKWRPSMHGGVKSLIIPADSVWTPDILHYQSVFEEFETKYESNVEVLYDGRCSWLPPAILYSSCEVDMTYFPFDIQTCPLKFGSWSYTKSLLDLKIAYPTNNVLGAGQTGQLLIDQGQYIKSSTWEIVGRESLLHEIKYDCCPETYIDITFYLKLRRFTYYPSLTLVLPCALTALLVVLTFILPPEAGEKVSLNITILLAMVVFMDQLSQQTPPMSSNLPVIGKFFVAAMIIISFSLVSTILCLKLHHSHIKDGLPMPKWTRCLVMEIMPTVLCMSPPAPSLMRHWEDDQPKSVWWKKQEKISTNNDDEILFKLPHRLNKESSEPELYLIYSEVKFLSDYIRQKEALLANQDEWKYAALVLDRFCAWMFMMCLTLAFLSTICATPDYIRAQ